MSSVNQDDGTNIQVVVRIRPNNENEKKGRHPNVITAISDTEIRVQNTMKNASLTDKMFTYDKVFTSSATQEDVYASTAEPLIDEVIAGYNATIMAYGQTSSGKTHTICGWDTNMNELSNKNAIEAAPDANAGLIPRCVHTLFSRLQKLNVEFTIKVSFLELYNEELTDLTSDDFSKQLRIYEDPKQGTLIQNLDETHVTSAADVFTLLKKAQSRRHVAETSFNTHSSRSHYIFTIVCHIKDIQDNEELFRTGKLHLVDLAGSESFWNPKNEEKEKRLAEAGKINQSLLALGRVITALVQKQISIPFRDSKLTRILKDSFTKSKTAIIATISPSLICCDESVSTLDYAYRAKSIKNKPQVNERITQKHYFRDLVTMISSLKAENAALRSKNGIYLPPDHYKQLTDGYNLKCDELTEAQHEIESKNVEVLDKEITIQYKTDVLDIMGKEYSRSNHSLLLTRYNLEKAKKTLYSTNKALAEEQFYAQTLSRVEDILHTEGDMLIHTSQELDGENDKLYAKIARQEVQEHTNLNYIQQYQSTVLDKYVEMCQIVDDDNEKVKKQFDNSKNQLSMFNNMSSHTSAKLTQAVNSFEKNIETEIHSADTTNNTTMDEITTENSAFQQSILTQFHHHNDDIKTMATKVNTKLLAQQDVLTSNHLNQIKHINTMKTNNETSIATQNDKMNTFQADFTHHIDTHREMSTNHSNSILELIDTQGKFETQNHKTAQNDAITMLKHVSNYKNIHTTQHNDVQSIRKQQHERDVLYIENILQKEANNHEINVAQFTTTGQILNAQHLDMNDKMVKTNDHFDKYDEAYANWATNTQTATADQHHTTISHITRLNANSTQWFENYNNELINLQSIQQQQHQDYQSTTQKMQDMVSTFQTSMQNQLKTDTSTLLSTLSNLIQTFVSTQEQSIEKHSNSMVQLLATHQLQTQHDFSTSQAQYDEKINKLHTKFNEESNRQYQQLKGTKNEHFVESMGNIQNMSTIHKTALTTAREVHFSPMAIQLDENCKANVHMVNTHQDAITDEHNTRLTALNTYVANLTTNHTTLTATTNKNHETHSTSNYPIMITKLTTIQRENDKNNAQRINQHGLMEAAIKNHDVSLATQCKAAETAFIQSKDDISSHINMLHTTNMDELNKNAQFASHNVSNLTSINTELQLLSNENTNSLVTSNTLKLITPTTIHCQQIDEKMLDLKTALNLHSSNVITQVRSHKDNTLPIVTLLETNAKGFTSTFSNQLEKQSQQQLKHNTSLSSSINSLTNTLHVLTTDNVQAYQPTGQTPMKKQWTYPITMSSSLPKDDILNQYSARNAIVEENAWDILTELTENDTTHGITSFNLDSTILLDDNQTPLSLTSDQLQMINTCIQYQPASTLATSLTSNDVNAENIHTIVNLIDIDLNNVTPKDLYSYSLLSSLPTPNLPAITHNETIINTEVTDQADNTSKSHQVQTIIDPNPKIIKGRHDLLTSMIKSAEYVSDARTNAIIVANTQFNTKVSNQQVFDTISIVTPATMLSSTTAEFINNTHHINENNERAETNINTDLIQDEQRSDDNADNTTTQEPSAIDFIDVTNIIDFNEVKDMELSFEPFIDPVAMLPSPVSSSPRIQQPLRASFQPTEQIQLPLTQNIPISTPLASSVIKAEMAPIPTTTAPIRLVTKPRTTTSTVPITSRPTTTTTTTTTPSTTITPNRTTTSIPTRLTKVNPNNDNALQQPVSNKSISVTSSRPGITPRAGAGTGVGVGARIAPLPTSVSRIDTGSSSTTPTTGTRSATTQPGSTIPRRP